MTADISHAVARTLAVFDQLQTMWGEDVALLVSAHGLTHEQIHRLHQLGGTEDGPSAEYSQHPYIRVQLTTPAGRPVGFFGTPDLGCDRCRELLGLPATGCKPMHLAWAAERMQPEAGL